MRRTYSPVAGPAGRPRHAASRHQAGQPAYRVGQLVGRVCGVPDNQAGRAAAALAQRGERQRTEADRLRAGHEVPVVGAVRKLDDQVQAGGHPADPGWFPYLLWERSPHRRGLAMGLNEAAGYLAVAGTAAATGALAAQYGLRPAPFMLALAYAALGLGLSAFFVKETRGHAHLEAGTAANGAHGADLPTRQVAALVSYREPALSSAAQAGMVNNLNDGL